MPFIVDKAKTGKPCILFNGIKYRQQRFLKNGKLWRVGKRKLAELVVESLAAECTVPLRKNEAPRPTLRNEGASSETAEPFVLPHDSYADAFRKTLVKEPVFLETPTTVLLQT
ncbi:hypothetical protein J6590_018835 [Homalodisca vitripennis]|nr:hypothetical protein J6590_018835 [Homalodisca vitripennis]